MKQLTGVDASFLYMETGTTYGHVSGLSIYERPTPDYQPFEAVRERMAAIIGLAEPFQRRLVEVPLRLDHPYWINDPDFDLDFHVRHLGLAPPGAADQLAEQVARIVGRRMDRSHPLWEVYVIEGLADGRWAMLTKTHHATIDGASGVILLNMITDTDPDAPPIEPVPWSGEPVPSDTELLSLTARSLVANPVKGLRLQLRMVQDVAESFGVTSLTGLASAARGLVRQVTSTASAPDNERRVRIPITPAPPTPWNRNVSAHRRFAMRSTSLENIKRLKTATGGTVNDVVMAICTGALREYLLRHDALPDRPLRAMVPVSIRTGEEDDPWTNRVSAIIADLPTDCDDPVERVARCREAMAEAKRQFELVPAETLTDMTQTASPLVAVAAVRLMQRVRFADRVGFPFNVVISNVPGPRDPLYFAGAKLCHYIPVSTIADGVGLNITVHSYVDRLDFGLISCRNLVPDLWDLVDLHIAEIERLFEAAGAEWAEPQDVPSMRVGGSHSRPEPGKAARRAAAGSASGGRSTAKRSTGKRSTAKRSTAKAAGKRSTAKRSTAKRSTGKRSTATRRRPAS